MPIYKSVEVLAREPGDAADEVFSGSELKIYTKFLFLEG